MTQIGGWRSDEKESLKLRPRSPIKYVQTFLSL
jgi:hypothetical protein